MIIGFDGRYAENDLVGIGKYIQNLTSGIAKKGNTCIVFYSKKPKNKIPGITEVVLDTQNRYYFEQILLPIALIKHKIEIYHALGNIGVPFLKTVHVVLTVQDTIPLDLKGYFNDSRFPIISKFSYTLRLKSSMFLADKITTTTKYMKSNLVKNYGINSKKVDVINLGVTEVTGKSKLPNNLKKDQYLLNNGGIDIRKNQERLLTAFSLIKPANPNIKLVITGKNLNMEPNLKRLSKTYGLAQDVVFPGYLSEINLWTLIKNSKALVYPSLMEGFGIPVLEGFAAGVPVISSNTTSIPEISEDAALLVNPLDVAEIALAIKKILSDKKLCASLIAKGKKVVKKYSWENTIERTFNEYLNLYNRI